LLNSESGAEIQNVEFVMNSEVERRAQKKSAK
jgi:hypothetical protein